MTDTTRLYPAVTIDQDWAGCLRMWQGVPRLAHWQDPYPPADVLVQADIERGSILESLTAQELSDYAHGYRVTTYNIDPAVFGEQAAKAAIRRQECNEKAFQELRRNKGK